MGSEKSPNLVGMDMGSLLPMNDRCKNNKNHKVGDWCCYGWDMGYWGFGRIEKIDGDSIFIRYSEGQMFPSECWESEWVDIFPTLKDAVKEYLKVFYPDGYSEDLLKKEMWFSFPSEANKK